VKQSGRNGGTLNVGNPGNKGGGRLPMSKLKDKEEWLDELMSEDFDPHNAHPLVKRLREIAETSSSSATLEYIFNQKFGAPKSTTKVEVADASVFKALGEILPRHADQSTCRAILLDLHAALNPDA
jgi:hypothetical protein